MPGLRGRSLLPAAVIHAIVDSAKNVRADFIHVRNKQATARELLEIVRHYRGQRVIVNSRMDVALAAGAVGLHLASDAPSPAEFRGIAPPGFLIGVSCHNREDLERAEAEGADYAYLSPVFQPLSKAVVGPVLGLEGFARSIEGLRIPVLALGGITMERIPLCIASGAAGVAGISLAETL